MRISIPIATGGGRSNTRMPMPSASLEECLGSNGKIDRSIAAIANAPSSTDVKSGATSAHGAANGFAEVNLTMTTSALTARKRKRRKTRKEIRNEG